jgi:hypothetical protein
MYILVIVETACSSSALALMNNNDMPLSIYGLRPGSYVTMKVVKSNNHKEVSM